MSGVAAGSVPGSRTPDGAQFVGQLVGAGTASTMAYVLPACAMTLVFGAKSIHSIAGPGRGGSPSTVATCADRTQRFRTSGLAVFDPDAMDHPSPVNQW